MKADQALNRLDGGASSAGIRRCERRRSEEEVAVEYLEGEVVGCLGVSARDVAGWEVVDKRGRKNVRWSCSWWRESTSWYATASFGLLPFFPSWVTLRLACDRSIRAGTSIAFPCHHHRAQAAAREGRRWRCREAADEECRKDAEKTQKNAAAKAFLSMFFCVSGDVFLGEFRCIAVTRYCRTRYCHGGVSSNQARLISGQSDGGIGRDGGGFAGQ